MSQHLTPFERNSYTLMGVLAMLLVMTLVALLLASCTSPSSQRSCQGVYTMSDLQRCYKHQKP